MVGVVESFQQEREPFVPVSVNDLPKISACTLLGDRWVTHRGRTSCAHFIRLTLDQKRLPLAQLSAKLMRHETERRATRPFCALLVRSMAFRRRSNPKVRMRTLNARAKVADLPERMLYEGDEQLHRRGSSERCNARSGDCAHLV